MNLLYAISLRSTCKKYKVACIIVNADEKNIISFGYNGTPTNRIHCENDENEEHFGETELHAEINALAKIRGEYTDLDIWVTHKPCLACAKTIISFKKRYGISRIYYIYEYKDKCNKEVDIGKFLLDEDIKLIKIREEDYKQALEITNINL
jgi:deoxycytidylate deaminase